MNPTCIITCSQLFDQGHNARSIGQISLTGHHPVNSNLIDVSKLYFEDHQKEKAPVTALSLSQLDENRINQD
jgi:hypothetical protein